MGIKSENYGLSEAIKKYKESTSEITSTNFQKELWGAWRFNHNMYVPVL